MFWGIKMGLHCLYNTPKGVSSLKRVKVNVDTFGASSSAIFIFDCLLNGKKFLEIVLFFTTNTVFIQQYDGIFLSLDLSQNI